MSLQQVSDPNLYKELWQSRGGHLLQSWEWGETREGGSKWQVQRYILIDQIPLSIFVRRLPGLAIRLGYAPRLNLSSSELPLVTDILRQSKLVDLLVIDPNWAPGQVDIPGSFTLAKQIQPQQTNQVELSGTEDELWEGLKSKYRRNIKKAKREQVEVESYTKSDQASIGDFYTVMQTVAANTDFLAPPITYFQTLANKFSEIGSYQLLVAKRQGELAGAYMLLADQQCSYELYGGVTLLGRDTEAGYLLKWQAMLAAKEQGRSRYDHWGTAPLLGDDFDKKHPLYGISRFKSGFGGEQIQFEKQLQIGFKPGALNYYRTVDTAKGFYLGGLKLLKRLRH